jgi:hypothetical protein
MSWSAVRSVHLSKAKGFSRLLFLLGSFDAIALLLPALSAALEWLGAIVWRGSVKIANKFECASHFQ